MLCSSESLRASLLISQHFKTTRKLRRAVLKEFEQQQKADSEAAVKIRNCVLASTKELLQSLSTLLESYGEAPHVSQTERQIFSAIAPFVSLDEWLQLREQHASCERKATLLREHLKEAQKSYDEVSPLGVISKLFKNENENRIFDALKSNRDKAADSLSDVDEETRRLESCIRQKSTDFLRQAMSEESLQFIRNASSPISHRVRESLDKMAEDLQKLINAHAAAQLLSLTRVQEH